MTDDFYLDDGQYHCANSECDWWVPEGMEHLAENHDCSEWAEQDKEYTDEALTQELQESIDRLLDGESASEEEVREAFAIVDEEPDVELDAENDGLSDIPTQSEVEEEIDELKEVDDEDVEEMIADGENPLEMTDLERDVVVPRVENLDEADTCSVDEFLERFEDELEDEDEDDSS
jgi:hypothetical protein